MAFLSQISLESPGAGTPAVNCHHRFGDCRIEAQLYLVDEVTAEPSPASYLFASPQVLLGQNQQIIGLSQLALQPARAQVAVLQGLGGVHTRGRQVL